MTSQPAQSTCEKRFPTTGPKGAAAAAREPIRTLLWTAATHRPIEEVAALVTLLRQTGEIPSPGDEALRAAAVARPVDEVMQLVALLNTSPHEGDDAVTALRAAAVGRPIEEVAQLVAVLGADQNHSPAPVGAAAGQRESSNGAVGAGSRTGAPPRPSHRPGIPPRPVHAHSAVALRHGAPPLRSVLRRPAAAALFSCGVIHLPVDLSHLRAGGYADALSLAITVCCLVLGVWLAIQDTTGVWAATAATAVGIVVVQGLSGIGAVSLPQSSLGETFAWASVVAVLLAAASALLAVSALMARQKAVSTGPGDLSG
ncbi:hypothetical protein NLX86_18495 [Streptomyces sp. A3M-1-3]|uniref:hypothetical protein n=1 Tax=Streptomyces sp. A3M-1-3 TaxID=2962044 RepID=UPI0020B71BCC|nr:hypothetical protein [Streptomyces sp. A3M-1-3]MCP3820009.1 hypothetical protein [Streptomyces sp. A3M-1-3]